MWRFNIHEITFIRHFGCCSKCLLNIPLLALASMLIKHYLDPINSKTFISNSKNVYKQFFFTSNTRFCIMVWQRLFYIYIYSKIYNHFLLLSSNFTKSPFIFLNWKWSKSNPTQVFDLIDKSRQRLDDTFYPIFVLLKEQFDSDQLIENDSNLKLIKRGEKDRDFA